MTEREILIDAVRAMLGDWQADTIARNWPAQPAEPKQPVAQPDWIPRIRYLYSNSPTLKYGSSREAICNAKDWISTVRTACEQILEWNAAPPAAERFSDTFFAAGSSPLDAPPRTPAAEPEICPKCGGSLDSDRHRYCALNPIAAEPKKQTTEAEIEEINANGFVKMADHEAVCAERDRAVEDAKRYRWLFDRSHLGEGAYFIRGPKSIVGKTMGECIDAALAGQS